MSVERRSRILEVVRGARGPVTGTELAHQLGVSRQIIVQDVAILRAAGEEIIATPRGYLRAPTHKRGGPVREVLAVQHGRELIEAELTALVDVGVRIVDVIVEHAVYGELRGNLMIESRADVVDFMRRIEGSEPLSTLTRGVHLHTVEATRVEAIMRGKEALRQLGVLLIDKTAV